MHRRDLIRFAAAAGAVATAPALRAQAAYPSRALRLVVPFPPGGPTDIFARQYAQRLSTVLGQPVVVENKSGASGAIGAVDVKNAEPDGYSLLFGTATTHGLYNLITRAPQYDALRDFTHVAIVGGAAAAFGVGPGMPQTLRGLIDMARASPGKVQYGSPGEGTTLHLAVERMKREVGNFDIQHIPFRGGAQSLPALIGGQVGMSVDTLGPLIPHHKSGKIRIVAVASARRSPLMPDVPTVDEAAGTRGFESVLWNVVAAPARLPPAILATLAAATQRVMGDATLHQQLAALAIEPTVDSGPAAAAAYIRAEMERWRPVVEASGLRM
ncbi:MAG: tripartite tricarboxylate transporter substrate binding protein [Burkholderiales bacterium]|nr:tripartite tricarboxylate transporter substrate binding protein [Burkholderiales bacterium]